MNKDMVCKEREMREKFKVRVRCSKGINQFIVQSSKFKVGAGNPKKIYDRGLYQKEKLRIKDRL